MDLVHIQHKVYNDYIDLLKIDKLRNLLKHTIALYPNAKKTIMTIFFIRFALLELTPYF